jgi:hypothetical protein
LSAAQTPSSIWFGAWTLNVALSTFGPAGSPYKRGTRTIRPAGDGAVTIVDDQVRIRGGILHLEWTGKFDGRDYSVQGAETALTVAYRCSGERTCDLIQRIDGDVVATARVTISPDGRVLTTTAVGTAGGRATLIYERR